MKIDHNIIEELVNEFLFRMAWPREKCSCGEFYPGKQEDYWTQCLLCGKWVSRLMEVEGF